MVDLRIYIENAAYKGFKLSQLENNMMHNCLQVYYRIAECAQYLLIMTLILCLRLIIFMQPTLNLFFPFSYE